ncbi:MAG: hypothetical protein Q8S29_05795 [Phreatobacter sp.]|nr:hypothetical protein [Phreatobacter sp.]
MADKRDTDQTQYHALLTSYEPAVQTDLPGVECGIGWHDLLKAFLDRASGLALPVGGTVTLQRIKEEFGEIRIYFRAEGLGDDAMNDLLAAAQIAGKASVVTCEECGRPGRLGAIQGNYATLCDDHRAEMERRFKGSDERHSAAG